MILVDSSGWIEFFADGPRADRYAPYLKRPDEVVTPTVVLYEVYRKLRHSLSMADAFILATARHANCPLVTSDAHFQELSGVTYIA